MDARIDLAGALGIRIGDAHILRNAGAVVTEDVIRSLVISQQIGATTSLMVVRHTDCAAVGLDEDALRARLGESAAGLRLHAIADLEEDLRRSLDELAASPLLAFPLGLRGFIYDVATGELREIPREDPNLASRPDL